MDINISIPAACVENVVHGMEGQVGREKGEKDNDLIFRAIRQYLVSSAQSSAKQSAAESTAQLVKEQMEDVVVDLA